MTEYKCYDTIISNTIIILAITSVFQLTARDNSNLNL